MAAQQATAKIQLQTMGQLAEAVDPEDDWTGVTDAAIRRKRQNRLNVRAHRRRKAREQQLSQSTVALSSRPAAEPAIPCWVEGKQAVFHLPFSVVKVLGATGKPLLPWVPAPVKWDGVILPLSSDHLIPLLQFNAIRAGIANRQLLSRLQPIPSAHDECSSVALHVLPAVDPAALQAIPPSLYPTALQCTVPHESWIDIIPHPTMRDNVIQAVGTFDEYDLWSDTIGGLFEGFPASEIELRGVIVWGTPWDASGWEVSEGFLRKWGWALKGCADVLEATNRWRTQRSESPLVFEN